MSHTPLMVPSPGHAVAASPLLQTKLVVPRARPGLVPRPRLIERLNRGAEGKLTLVSAPAGFGKTTLLAEWLAAAPAEEQSAAWVSLDQSDNHVTTFWTYFIAALRTVEPSVGANAIALLQSAPPAPMQTVLTLLLNELSAISDNEDIQTQIEQIALADETTKLDPIGD